MAAFMHWNKRFQSDDVDAPFEITQVELKRDFANAVLTLTVDYDNRSGDTEVNTAGQIGSPSHLRLVTTSGQTPDLFFLPGVYPPIVEMGERKEFTIIYWLKIEHLREGLYLEVSGNRATVKEPATFDLNLIENQTSIYFTDPNWSKP